MSVWDERIRPGDVVTSVMLGELARNIDGMYTGVIDYGYWNGQYIFSIPYSRKPPYLIVASFSGGVNDYPAASSSTLFYDVWLYSVPQLQGSPNFPDFEALDTIYEMGEPDARLYGAGDVPGTVAKFIEEAQDIPPHYIEGVEYYPDRYFGIRAYVRDAANANDWVTLSNVVVSVFGGR